MGKLAFMPGKIIHTNEILVLLGEQYYAERSAKQAIDILGRRRQVVTENLGLVEAQLNSFKQKTSSIMTTAKQLPVDPQINEEGLPIMDIREELPDDYEEVEKKKSAATITPASNNDVPESVLRARALMKEADEKINQEKQDTETKALFDLLKELEEEEEEEEGINPVVPPPAVRIQQELRPEKDSDDDSDSFDDSDDDRYDTEISANMFDRFGDDEEYPLDGVVDQEDFTAYDEVPEVAPATLKEIVEEDEEDDRSTPKLITKPKSKSVSKFKQQRMETTVKENMTPQSLETKVKETPPIAHTTVKENVAPPSVHTTVKENVAPPSVKGNAGPKKFSKFKLLRQQPRATSVQTPADETPVDEIPSMDTHSSANELHSIESNPSPSKPLEVEPLEAVDEEETIHVEPKTTPTFAVQDNGIPKVATKPKKMSRFKLARQKTEPEVPIQLDAPVQARPVKPKRTVTWDSDISIKDHDTTMAPSVVSETTSYSQPMKTTPSPKKGGGMNSLFKQMRQQDFVDDYPSLDEGDNDTKVDLNELIQVARESSEAFWRSSDGSDAMIPIIQQEESEEEEPQGIIVAGKSKLDNKIMKGAVMERDIAPVDLEKVEDDMEIREVTSSYQQMRQSMLATTGGFTFASKPEFEVFDEELPIPRKPGQVEEEEEEELPPKKMSRFKAARLGMRMDTDQDEYQ